MSKGQDMTIQSTRPITPEEIAFYRQNGYVIIRGLFERQEMDLVKKICESDPALNVSLKKVVDSNGNTWGASVWKGVNDSLVSTVTRTARMVEAVEAMTGEEGCYHMYSKIVKKKPYDESIVHWHQAFPSWYDDGVPFPDLATDCSIAITPCTASNGCLRVIERSHLLGRINRVDVGNTVECDPQHIERALVDLEIVDCEMDVGDVVFFHPNIVHGSVQNKTGDTRILMHCHYNALSNRPFRKDLPAHSSGPLEKLPDSSLLEGHFKQGFDPNANDWNWYNRDAETYLAGLENKGAQAPQSE